MMIQGNYVRAAVAKLQRSIDEREEIGTQELSKLFGELILWVDMVERKLEQVEVEARRPKFF